MNHHLKLAMRHVGSGSKIGSSHYRVRGYFANRLDPATTHEPELKKVLSRVLEGRAGAFVDVGVNTGQTFLKVLAIDPQRRYFGFEPLVNCAFLVQQFIADNDLENARVLPIALSDANGLREFFHGDGYDEMASLIEKPDASRSWVQTRIADEVFAEVGLEDIAVVKIDVEGAEGRVLAGMRQTLQTRRPVVLFEQLPNFEGTAQRVRISPERVTRNNAAAAQIWDVLTAARYSICQIDNRGADYCISEFDLDNQTTYVGRDYIAYPQ